MDVWIVTCTQYEDDYSETHIVGGAYVDKKMARQKAVLHEEEHVHPRLYYTSIYKLAVDETRAF